MSSSPSVFTVIGGTGKVGGFTLRALLDAGHKVRAVVRDEKKSQSLKELGAELVVVTDLLDTASLTKAFTGTDGVFIMTPHQSALTSMGIFATATKPADLREAHLKLVETFKKALVDSKVKKAVVLSSIGAHLPKGLGPIEDLYDLERGLETLAKDGVGLAFLRAGGFMENILPYLGVAKAQGILPVSFPVDPKNTLIACEDIGNYAAKVLQEDFSTARYIELEGPVRLSYHEEAAAISKLLGKEVKLAPVPKEKWTPTFTGFGMPPVMAEWMTEFVEGMHAGLAQFEGGHEHVKTTTTFEEFLKQHL